MTHVSAQHHACETAIEHGFGASQPETAAFEVDTAASEHESKPNVTDSPEAE